MADQARILAAIERLVVAADGDTLYRDVYLRRAAELVATMVDETAYAAAQHGQGQLDRLMAQAQAAVARKDWPQVREVGARAAAIQRSLQADKAVLSAADAVYGAPPVALDPLSPGLSSRRWPNAAQAHAAVTTALGELAQTDVKSRDFYAGRQRALAGLSLPGAAAGAAGEGASAATVEQQALQALERGDAAALEGLASTMLGGGPAGGAEGGTGRRAAIVAPPVLGEPLPPACIASAKALGLEAAETAVVSPAVASAVGQFVEEYALGASPAVYDRAHDGVSRLVAAASELPVPSDVAAVFSETVSLFALHLYVNSAGIRYVPIPAPKETVLVEAHADGDDAATPLLRELGFDRRRALTRDDIEARLLKHGARIVRDLGLDPHAFRLVCVPPDLFMRLGRQRGWGERDEWTHFDGYQVMKGARLRALVGGNAKFGGLADLCSISHDDARENTLARFAVIHRERLGVRIA